MSSHQEFVMEVEEASRTGNSWEFPGGPVVGLSAFIAVAQVGKLVRELRSCKLHTQPKQTKRMSSYS